MRILQTFALLILAYFLLTALWPLLLVLLAIIVYQFIKARRIMRQDFQQAPPDQNFETYRQDQSGDVIDASYTERSESDGSK